MYLSNSHLFDVTPFYTSFLSELLPKIPTDPWTAEEALWSVENFRLLVDPDKQLHSPKEMLTLLVVALVSMTNNLTFDKKTSNFGMSPTTVKCWKSQVSRLKTASEALATITTFTDTLGKACHPDAPNRHDLILALEVTFKCCQFSKLEKVVFTTT